MSSALRSFKLNFARVVYFQLCSLDNVQFKFEWHPGLISDHRSKLIRLIIDGNRMRQLERNIFKKKARRKTDSMRRTSRPIVLSSSDFFVKYLRFSISLVKHLLFNISRLARVGQLNQRANSQSIWSDEFQMRLTLTDSGCQIDSQIHNSLESIV